MNVVTPIAIIFGITALRNLIEGGGVKLPVVVGSFVFGVLLFGINEVSPEVAMAFAWVAAITAVLINGAPVFKAVSEGF